MHMSQEQPVVQKQTIFRTRSAYAQLSLGQASTPILLDYSKVCTCVCVCVSGREGVGVGEWCVCVCACMCMGRWLLVWMLAWVWVQILGGVFVFVQKPIIYYFISQKNTAPLLPHGSDNAKHAVKCYDCIHNTTVAVAVAVFVFLYCSCCCLLVVVSNAGC